MLNFIKNLFTESQVQVFVVMEFNEELAHERFLEVFQHESDAKQRVKSLNQEKSFHYYFYHKTTLK